jgi:hypothetical protein
MKNSVICTFSKIKPGCLENVRNWLSTLKTRKEEVLESFRQEGVILESAFIREENNQHFLVYYMFAKDVEVAMSIFRESKLDIDHFHQKCWKEFTENHQILEPLFHQENLVLHSKSCS